MELITGGLKISETISKNLEEQLSNFNEIFEPLEKNKQYLFIDKRTKAIFFECHIQARKLIELSTIDVPLDPDFQAEYRANRDVVEDHYAYTLMKSDALNGRCFSNIIGEYNVKFNKEYPFKIIGGQHRYNAIKEAYEKKIDEYHGIKVYFLLDTKQRLDVQLISNTNIAVAGDLLDRMYETVRGPELRQWCQSVGLLETGCDFSDRKQRGSRITVRGARSFILSYFEGAKHNSRDFDKIKPEPIIAKTGVVDEQWDKLRLDNPQMWINEKLIEAGTQYAKLYNAQYDAIISHKGSAEYAEKALNYAIISSWAYVSGLLQDNQQRLIKHYALADRGGTDPLNANAMAKARHRTDPENYRGLSTRTDMKERGRLVELFFAQAEKGEGIKSGLIDYAVKSYHAKLAFIEADEAKKKI